MKRAVSWSKVSISALVAALMALALAFGLVGCTSNSNSGSSEGSSETKSETTASSSSEKTTLQIFAANSLSKAMEEVEQAYIAAGNSNIEFADTQYKASGELNEMLGAGSYADLLISAS